jgi:hypothetical protein
MEANKNAISRSALDRIGPIALVIAVVAIALAQFVDGIEDAVETTVLLALVALFVASPSVRQFVAAAPRAHRFVAIPILAAVVMGQIVNENRALFPFAAWSMYASGVPEENRGTNLTRLIGIDETGRRQVLDVESLFGLMTRRAIQPLDGRTTAYLAARTPTDRRTIQDAMALRVQAVMRTWNERHPERPIRHIEIERAWLPHAPDSAEATAEWIPVAGFDAMAPESGGTPRAQ